MSGEVVSPLEDASPNKAAAGQAPVRTIRRHPRQLLPGDRLEVIESLLEQHGRVRASELAELFGVTDETIRRDLTRLAKTGRIRREHGGAATGRAQDERTTSVRLRENAAEKIAIGNRAALLVEEESTIALDSGTTTLCLARALRSRVGLLVVTTAVTNAFELVDAPGVTVVMAGGVVRPATYGATGRFTVAMLHDVHVNQAFLGIHSVSAKAGLTYPRFEEADVKRAMIEAASRVVLLADHSKFGRESLVKVAPLTAVHTIVTTPGIDPAEAEAIRDMGVELIIAPIASSDLAADGELGMD
jgi:DeoR/GlpR family transcriptional regulator of sugar metabolism